MPSIRNTLLAGLLAALTLGSALAADPANPAARRIHPARSAFPLLDLGIERAKGQRAVDLLGSRLEAVAAWYGKSADEFAAMLVLDRTLRLDRRGRLFVEEELSAPPPAPMAASPILDGSLLPLDQTFKLHSRAGAKRTIYLNFNGGTFSNTAWNAGSFTAQPFDIDGVPGNFSNTELERIQYIWQRVSEDYAPFDVDVTTEAPAADVLTRSSGSDQIFGTTVLITNRAGVYDCSCGGVAYVGVFDDVGDFYKPALVFYDALGGGGEKYVAEAISHEAGHNIGLSHDGYPGGGYYGGHGSGATGWAPIMGVGYYQALAQWSKGEYSGADNVQNDFAVAESYGLPIRLDDHGDSTGTATPLKPVTVAGVTTLQGDGVIERASDVDYFSFSAAAGPISINVSPAARSPNLDVMIELRNSAGAVLASANPAEALNASLTHTAALAGTYYVTVQGVGKGDPLGTGYTDYGSVGLYALAVSAGAVTSNTPPTAAATATPSSGIAPLTVAFSSVGSSDPDGTIAAYEWSFGDGSAVATTATASHTYGVGTFTAQLKVTDNGGLSATKAVTITVSPVVVVPSMRVADIAMSLVGNARLGRATAKVKVFDANGVAVPGATVSGTWSGLVTGNGNAVTASSGIAGFTSPVAKKAGTFIFTVTGVTLQGWTYKPDLNTETTDSITR
jgi:PKD repeat protein